MKKYTLKYFREMVRLGLAIDISQVKNVTEISSKCEKIGYSCSSCGINGGMLQDTATGEIYVIIGRGANLFRVF